MALHALTLLLCTFSLSLSFAVASSHMASSSSSSSCSVVTPSTPLVSFLEQLQETALQTFGDSNFDPKTYVDLPLKFTLSETHQAFQNLPRLSSNGTVSAEVLKGFINRYFKGAGDDLVCWQPHDFVAEPEGFLTKVKHPEVRAWALKVHSLWRNLSRKVSREVEKNPQLHTLLPLPNPVVIPGSRFREVYYWDSYWVIRGLLVSKMHKTATAIVMNLVSLIEKYGFVLNGARQYYTNRSQPPLLSSMIYEIYRSTGDIELVKRCLPALLKEHAFWNSDIHRVTIVDAQGHSHNLNRYQAMWNKPRPESSTMDKKSASKFLNISEKQDFYRDIASAAESGWDFSTRWMRVPPDYSTLATTSVIPVDLNAYLLGMEINIAFFAKAIGDETTVKHFMELSDARKKAINSVFWSASKKQWLDYWLNSGTCEVAHVWEAKHQNKNVFASNFVPLWMEPFYSDGSLVDIVVHALKTSGLIRAAGIATSLTDSGQQWDFPNGWAPLQHMLAEGLVKSGSKEARLLAEEIAIKWIRSNYVSYKKTGVMHEKLDVEKCGEYGGGGEYAPQTGFGWSNGVVLAFLEEFGWPQDRSIDC